MVNYVAMDLKTHLTNTGTPATTFAEGVGVSVAALHRYISGQRIPRRDIMERITRLTGGAVQPNDFFNVPPASKSQEAA